MFITRENCSDLTGHFCVTDRACDTFIIQTIFQVIDECLPVIEEFGLELPLEMACENFPRRYEHPCVPIQPKSEPLPSGTLRWIKTESYEEDIPEKSQISEFQCPEGQLTNSDVMFPFAGIENCAQSCDPIHLGKTETAIFRLILAVFSVFSVMVSAFSILIFLRDRKRYAFLSWTEVLMFISYCKSV